MSLITAGHASASTQMCMVGVRPRFFLVFALRGSDPDFQAAFFTTSRTFMPARLAMLTSASRLNWPIFPLSSALRRGCVRPSAFAPAACVMPLFRWNSTMRIIRSDRIFRFSASTLSNPRSIKMLSPPRTILSFLLMASRALQSAQDGLRILRYHVEQHERGTAWFAVAALPVPEGPEADSKGRSELFLRQARPLANALHVHHPRHIELQSRNAPAVPVPDGLLQAALDACKRHFRHFRSMAALSTRTNAANSLRSAPDRSAF